MVRKLHAIFLIIKINGGTFVITVNAKDCLSVKTEEKKSYKRCPKICCNFSALSLVLDRHFHTFKCELDHLVDDFSPHATVLSCFSFFCLFSSSLKLPL